MENDLLDWKKKLEEVFFTKKKLLSTVSEHQQTYKSKKENLEHLKEAQAHLQNIAELIQTFSHERLTKIASECLHIIFGNLYSVKLEFNKKRGKTESKFVYYKNKHKVNPLLTSGGVRNVVSFALRLTNILLQTNRKVIIMDEPFVGLDKINKKKIEHLLNVLSSRLDFQIILITHDDELCIGKVVHI